MKIGVCCGIERAAEAAALGFDYLEVNASRLDALTDREFEEALRRLEASGLSAPVCNVLFHDIRLLEPEGIKRLEDYLRRLLPRLARAGVGVAVFGSGSARRRPEGLAFGECWRRLCEAARVIGSVAGEYGVSIAVEALRRAESEMVNTVTEAAILAACTGLPNVGVLADSFHMFMENEPMEDIRRTGRLLHAHAALRRGRAYPTYADAELRLFMDALRGIGYGGRVSVEASTQDFARDAPRALAVLRMLSESGPAFIEDRAVFQDKHQMPMPHN